MSWESNLLPDQRQAACKTGCHVCVLAGPGTGKTLTLTRRIQYLVQEQHVTPHEILALTFTRAATYELKNRTSEELLDGIAIPPRISTLHSFALSQLLRNAPIITIVPRPLRIADDWEERYIIEEDLKRILNLNKIKDVRTKFHQLSADWETLNAEKDNWETEYHDPQFLSAWRKHRETYGYMLRSELVYQLKKSIEQNPDFTLEQVYKHILIDEYQDLNRCDLEVIKMLTTSGAHLYASGDDDQSIYGFRFAYPQGIRMFSQDYSPCEVLPLENCMRCGDNILQIALFVARLDVSRIEKTLIAYNTDQPGEVHLLNFPNQIEESQCIAQICRYLIEAVGIAPKDILILTRSDRNGVFSSVLKEALTMANVPVATQADVDNPLDQDEGRIFLSFLRLLVNPRDHLAWLTVLKIRNNGIGDQTISKIYEFAVAKGLTFIDALVKIINPPGLLSINENILQREYESINNTISQFRVVDTNTSEELTHFIADIADTVMLNQDLRKEATSYLQSIVTVSEITNLRDLLATISTSLGDKEQDIDVNSVNIMTMHKAKGLSAEAVFIVGAEDEYLPGDQIGEEKEGDERRLLYVSLTRAKRFLYITYCNNRTKRQIWSGRTPGQIRRTLSRFLVDSPLRPEIGGQYLRECISLQAAKGEATGQEQAEET